MVQEMVREIWGTWTLETVQTGADRSLGPELSASLLSCRQRVLRRSPTLIQSLGWAVCQNTDFWTS